MKYICECGKKFIHVAKTTMPHAHVTDATIEFYCCPDCGSTEYDEYVLDKKRIVSVLSVPLEEVDKYLAHDAGYEIESLYAKTATLVLRKRFDE